MTTSLQNPRLDFEVNVLGTFNLLESVKLHSPDSIIVYSSSLAFISIALVLGYLGCIMLFVYPRISQVKLIIKKSQAKILNFSQSLLSSRRQIALSNPYGFSKEFENITDQWLKAHADNSFYSSIPRVFLELAV